MLGVLSGLLLENPLENGIGKLPIQLRLILTGLEVFENQEQHLRMLSDMISTGGDGIMTDLLH